jgi:hypothetical protein
MLQNPPSHHPSPNPPKTPDKNLSKATFDRQKPQPKTPSKTFDKIDHIVIIGIFFVFIHPLYNILFFFFLTQKLKKITIITINAHNPLVNNNLLYRYRKIGNDISQKITINHDK